MSAMLDRLHQTHFGILPAAVYHELDGPGSREGNPGIDVRVIDGQVVVTAVDADSPAARRGVKPGWRITRVSGNELEPRLNGIRKQFAESTLLDIMQTRFVTSRLRGAGGNSVKVDFLDEADRPVTLELDL